MTGSEKADRVEYEAEEWFDPLTTQNHAPMVWDDGVHRIVRSELSGRFICFTSACNRIFPLPLLGLPVRELRLGNPVITCRKCLQAT